MQSILYHMFYQAKKDKKILKKLMLREKKWKKFTPSLIENQSISVLLTFPDIHPT